MRIAIDAGVIGTGRGGDETYMRNLLSGLALVAADRDHEFIVYLRAGTEAPADIAGDPRFTVRPYRVLPRALRYAVDLPLRVARERPLPDALLTTNHAPIVSPVARALLVHDLSFRHQPEGYDAATRFRLNWLVPLHIRQAKLVVTVSEFSRRDLMRSFGLDERRVAVVPNAVRERSARPESLRVRGVGERFFLYVGNLHPRKNVTRLIEAFALARRRSPAVAAHQLVIAGAPAWNAADVARAAASLPGIVVMLGRIDDAERDALLARATALTYVSLFEGFGLPPLEAMASGTPVLTSSTSAMPEVASGAAVLVDPYDVEAIALGLIRLAEDRVLRNELRQRGRERARSYSLRRTGEAAVVAFERMGVPTDRRFVSSTSEA
jgi:glycosyltransferase involved in cell wall biosynthesis